MKIIILAGGKGTRISEYTKTIPKPMIKIGNRPILIHIINHYANYGYKDFYIALGYKKNIILDYFKKFRKIDKPFFHTVNKKKIRITLSYTGENTLTGGRIKRMKKFINKLEENLGFKINKIELYNKAITHKSADKNNNYEKLEFLGDRVLGLRISKRLLEIFPDEKEGILDKK